MTTEQQARAIVWERSAGGRCEVCGREGHSLQHRVKRGQGGAWDPANLIRVCGDGTLYCHGWIEAHPRLSMVLGLWLPSTTPDPAAAPAYLRPGMWWRDWWTLDSAGCLTVSPPPADHTEDEIRAAIQALDAARLKP